MSYETRLFKRDFKETSTQHKLNWQTLTQRGRAQSTRETGGVLCHAWLEIQWVERHGWETAVSRSVCVRVLLFNVSVAWSTAVYIRCDQMASPERSWHPSDSIFDMMLWTGICKFFCDGRLRCWCLYSYKSSAMYVLRQKRWREKYIQDSATLCGFVLLFHKGQARPTQSSSCQWNRKDGDCRESTEIQPSC